MPRSILSALCFVLVPGLLFLGLYNFRTVDMAQLLQVNADVLFVDFGSTITVRHASTGSYLHSHDLFYPAGSKQQQVALAPQRSEATEWRIYNSTIREMVDEDALPVPNQPVVAGSTVMLRHIPTGKHLHSHYDHSAPVSRGRYLKEVTAYGIPGYAGDGNDDWVVELTGGEILTAASPFRLRHKDTGYYLSSRGAFLPQWGLGLQEVFCSQHARDDALWIIDAS
ncbi:Glycosyltransferase family 39 protein [Mycena sanguinolenta]|uniref:Glycosyltransferase family 39 protein n=1 Tax=Mycena sanguinolenta TaxID=230812 RepID=A0A8H7CXD3_9AGAR|nr:Glycosyltransferase family 39 protein [Mycena sanguinolenta]